MAGSGPLRDEVSGPADIPSMSLVGICNAVDLVAMGNFLEMLWSGLSHSRDIFDHFLLAGLCPAGTHDKAPG